MKDVYMPLTLFFLILIIGLLLGKIKLWRISLDVSAVLIVAVLLGFLGATFGFININDVFENQMSFLSSFGLALFVSVVGLLAGQTMAVGRNVKGKSLICFMLGILAVCIGFSCMWLIYIFDSSLDISMMYGVFCGAMTSTPGLAAVCEMAGVSSDAAVVGYGCAYLFGVLGVVTFVQFQGKRIESAFDLMHDREVPLLSASKGKNELIYICLTAVLGVLIGGIAIPGANISLGNSGGILCSGIVVGLCLSKKKIILNQSVLSIYRNWGLMMFFVGTGVPAGTRLVGLPEFKWLIYGAVITTMPIVLLFVICRYALKLSAIDTAFVIAGGMTSTPAIGILLKDPKKTPNLSAYSMTYVGALVAMVLLFKLIEMIS